MCVCVCVPASAVQYRVKTKAVHTPSLKARGTKPTFSPNTLQSQNPQRRQRSVQMSRNLSPCFLPTSLPSSAPLPSPTPPPPPNPTRPCEENLATDRPTMACKSSPQNIVTFFVFRSLFYVTLAGRGMPPRKGVCLDAHLEQRQERVAGRARNEL